MTSESLVRYANDWNCEAFGGRPEVSGRSERTATKLGGANGGGLASVAPTGEGCIGMHDNSVFLVPFYKPPFFGGIRCSPSFLPTVLYVQIESYKFVCTES